MCAHRSDMPRRAVPCSLCIAPQRCEGASPSEILLCATERCCICYGRSSFGPSCDVNKHYPEEQTFTSTPPVKGRKKPVTLRTTN
ncbi:hypothetical protein C8Q74DRAFT_1330020 [Fomes fomentarius]|nr:hypothetical protein C8Q74DRAFT_1330020 [Fomes fomentarius]